MIRKIFSSFLAIILVPFFSVFLVFISAKLSIARPDFYQDAFSKADLYNQLTNQAVPGLFAAVGTNADFGLGPLNAEDLIKVIQNALPPVWLQNQVEAAITQFFDFAYGKTGNLEIIVPLTEIKASASENLSQTFRTKIESLHRCTTEEVKDLQSQDQKGDFSFKCLPSEGNSEDLEEMVMASVTGKEGLLTQLPDQFNLGEIILKKPGASEAIPRSFTIFQLIFKILAIIVTVFVLLLMAINFRYLLGAFKWITIPLMIASGIVLALSVFVHLLSVGLIGGYLTILPAELKSAATTTAINLIGQLFSKFEVYSGIALGLSIVCLITVIILAKRYPYQIKPRETIRQ